VSYRLDQLRSKIVNGIARRFDRNRYPRTGKADIINLLGRTNGYASYLEIASRTTGQKFALVSEKIFQTKKRALYNVPDDYADGLPVHYRSGELSAQRCLQELIGSGQTFDIVFVDPYHSYDASAIDIELGWRLVKPGGVMVVHDCNPTDELVASAEFHGGSWCGQTYLAFLDFVARRPELAYCVVDTDWGVGLVFQRQGHAPKLFCDLPARHDLGALNLKDWKVFEAQRRRVLRLISEKQFLNTFVRSK
jgi:hypothetical protein